MCAAEDTSGNQTAVTLASELILTLTLILAATLILSLPQP